MTQSASVIEIDASHIELETQLQALRAKRSDFEQKLADVADDAKASALLTDVLDALDRQIHQAQTRLAALGKKRIKVEVGALHQRLTLLRKEMQRYTADAEELREQLADIEVERADILRCQQRCIEIQLATRDAIRNVENEIARLDPLGETA